MYKLIQHGQVGDLYYADTDGLEEIVAQENLRFGDRIYCISTNVTYNVGADEQLHAEGGKTVSFPSVEESLAKIADTLYDTSDDDTLSPSGSGVMTCRITVDPSSDDILYLDKTYREISDFVANNGMVQAVMEVSNPDTEYRTTIIYLLSSFRRPSVEGHYFVQFLGDGDTIEFYSSDIDGVPSTTPDVGPNS